MKFSVLTKRCGLGLAAAAGLALATCANTSYATLLWYDGFAIGADDGAGPNYVAGNSAGQLGGDDMDAPGGIGFFDGAGGDPNPWLGVNRFDDADSDNIIAPGSLSRLLQSPASTGDMSSDQGASGCCNVARSSRDMNTPLQNLSGTYYMGFLVNYGAGNPNDPHYRAVEFWNGKSTTTVIPDPDPDNPPEPDMDGNIPNPNLGRVGDPQLNMSIGVSSFGNYDNPQNDADGPGGVTQNRQVSVRVDGVREVFGSNQELKYQLEEHLPFSDKTQFAQTLSIVVKFDLTTLDIETGDGPGDTVSFFLNPKPGDTTEPTPSLVVPGVDLLIDSMSSLIAFQFNSTDPNRPGGFDELRVGTTWADVAILGVPEPATFSLLGLGAIGMLSIARRKRS
jgi:hypothetical protein